MCVCVHLCACSPVCVSGRGRVVGGSRTALHSARGPVPQLWFLLVLYPAHWPLLPGKNTRKNTWFSSQTCWPSSCWPAFLINQSNVFTSADVPKCYTETKPKTPNSKQCRCRSTVARKKTLERHEPRKKPRECHDVGLGDRFMTVINTSSLLFPLSTLLMLHLQPLCLT